jgi:type II secretory pathway component PulF
MPVYYYKARDNSGKAVTGTVEASSRETAGEHIENLGALPILIQEQAAGSSEAIKLSDFFGGNVKSEDMIMFTFQISTLIGAGIPLLTSLETLSKQIENRTLRSVLQQATRDVESGNPLSESLAKHPGVFPAIYANMIRAGEASGNLQEIFIHLGEMIEHEEEVRAKIGAALRYPKMVVFALGLAFAIVITFVMPRFVSVFNQFKLALPLPTRILIGMNTIILDYWAPVLIGIVLVFFLIKWMINTPKGRYWWDSVKLNLPIFGPLFLKVALSRFTYMMGILNRSGIPIIENLQLTAMSIGNDVVSEAIQSIRKSVSEGKGFEEPMKNIKLFTPLVVQMVAVGETSGELDDVLLKVSRYYDMEVDYGTRHLSTYLEPVLTLLIGIAVLFFALAIFLPMWDLTKIAGR